MGRVLVVTGASGGVGASVLAAAVAVRASRAGAEVVLVDGCPLGGGLDVVLGVEQVDGVRWSDLGRMVGAADGSALRARLPSGGGPPVLSFGRSLATPSHDVAAAVIEGLSDVADLVVVDAPVGGGSVAAAASARADSVVVVAADGVRALAALATMVSAVTNVAPGARTGVCLRSPSAGPAAAFVEEELGWPVVAVLGHDRRVDADLAHGIPPGERGRGPLTVAADEVLGWALLASGAAA